MRTPAQAREYLSREASGGGGGFGLPVQLPAEGREGTRMMLEALA